MSCLNYIQFLKGIAYARKDFYYVQFSYIIINITTLSSDQQACYVMRVSYHARQDPRIMQYGPCFMEPEVVL